MRYCILCRKQAVPDNGTFFNAPRDPSKREEWAKLCKKEFNTSTRICIDHFSKADIIRTGSRCMLLPKAMPIVPQQEETPVFSSNMLPDKLVNRSQMESHAEFELPGTSQHGLRFFTYEELTSTAASKRSKPLFKQNESQTEKKLEMKKCCICYKKEQPGNGTFFCVPKDESRREKWSTICKKKLSASNRICLDHFNSSHIVNAGRRVLLLPNAVPYLPSLGHQSTPQSSLPIKNTYSATHKVPKNNVLERSPKADLEKNILNSTNSIPLQLLEEPIVQIPIIKSVFCAGNTQTNTRLCGLVEASDFADEFRFNCFYCSEVFPLEKWKDFINHLKDNHFEMEEAFRTSKYVTEDHDYTPISIPPSTSADTLETAVFDSKPLPPFLVDPLEPTIKPFESMVLSSYYAAEENHKASNSKEFLTKFAKSARPLSTIPESTLRNKLQSNKETARASISLHRSKSNSSKKKNSKSKLYSSDNLYLEGSKRHTAKTTALSRCLKRTKEVEASDVEEKEEEFVTHISIDIVQQKPTEITFGYTPPHIVDLLLDSMKLYPVLWQFDDEPFNEDFYEVVEDLCKIINDKYSLNIDNLKMRRSINRILRYYCYLFPNTNVENIDQFTCYYDKCAAFLPSSINEIAYARCSHCYACYRNDFDLQLHLVEEQRYLQWPYKCVQCKECFREIDEYEFHKHQPHYDEIFRCQPCNKSFFRRNNYKRHMVECHPNNSNYPGNYKCNLCDKVLQTISGLRNHKNTHGEKQHRCHLCPKSFFENSKLKLHVKTHQKEYDFICEVCGKEFIVQSALKRHMKKHTGEKVTCNICNLKLRKSSLGRHLRTVHVALEGIVETPIKKRHIYYRRLIKSSPLRPIQRKCGEERKYQCKICNINFENYKLIVEHNKELHKDIPKWPCKMCTTEFSHKINLKRHYRKKHNLHVYQVYKLVDENEDLNQVLAIETEHIDKLVAAAQNSYKKKNDPDNATSKNETVIKTELLPDEIFFEEERIYSSTIQDEIMKAVDNIEAQDLKIDYMNDIFTDF